MEQTLVMIKPDGVRNKLVGTILSRLKEENFKITVVGILKLTRQQAIAFYKVHQKKHFFDELVEFIVSGEVVAMVIEGETVLSRIRMLIGATDPKKADPNTIRHKFGKTITENVIHASDSPQAFNMEVEVIFPNFRKSTPQKTHS